MPIATSSVHLQPCTCSNAIDGGTRYDHCQRIEAYDGAGSGDSRMKCEQALIWLKANITDIDCNRFLLHLRGVLRGKSRFFTEWPELYWESYGDLLGDLLRRETASTDGVNADEIWDELTDGFRHPAEQAWRQRAWRVLCFARVARRCANLVANPRSKHYDPFWTSIECFTAYFQAMRESPVPPPAEFTPAVRRLVIMWYQLVQYLAGPDHPIAENPRGHVALVSMGCLIYGLIAKLDMGTTSEMDTWQDGMCMLTDVGGPRRPEIQQMLNRLARDVASWYPAEVRQETRHRLSRLQQSLMPLVHNRSPRLQRLSMEIGDDVCDVLLYGDGRPSQSSRIDDVCPTRLLGFRLSIPNARTDKVYDGDSGLTGETLDGFRCREVLLYRDDDAAPAPTRELDLHLRFDGGQRTLRCRCKILRAWALTAESGVGLAVLAGAQEIDALGDRLSDWQKYIARLPRKAQGAA